MSYVPDFEIWNVVHRNHKGDFEHSQMDFIQHPSSQAFEKVLIIVILSCTKRLSKFVERKLFLLWFKKILDCIFST